MIRKRIPPLPVSAKKNLSNLELTSLCIFVKKYITPAQFGKSFSGLLFCSLWNYLMVHHLTLDLTMNRDPMIEDPN